tara:strand:+ start:897 stop:2207 length:1311 start_codon:yes stop_codon:yes gene_type:complete
MTVKTSSVSPIRIGSSSRDMRTLYTAIEVTEIESVDGEPVYTSRVIRYSDHRRNGATVIATGTTVTPGIFTPTVNATTEEKKYLTGGGIFVKTIKQQVNSIKKDFGRSPISAQQKENLNKIASGVKKALTVASGDQQGGRGSERSSIPVSLGGSGGGGGGARTSYPTLRYPETLNQNQDKLKISILKFAPKKFSGLSFAERSTFTERVLGSVLLPVPNAVNDANSCSWGQDTMNAAQIAASDIAMKTITEGAGAGMNTAEGVKDAAVKQGGADVKDALAQYFTGQATGVKGILARTKGQVINPNMELIFNGPQLRPFNFTFKMSPRDERESITIKKIIRMFKQSMAPARSESSLFLKAPNTFKLQFLEGSAREHKFLPKIKECAMTGFNVNYTPDGNYATYRNSAMVAVELSFSFQELEPIFNNDYDQDGDASIGF